jgi:hypothetical protein
MFAALPIQSVGHWWIPENGSKAPGPHTKISNQGQATLEFDEFTEPAGCQTI